MYKIICLTFIIFFSHIGHCISNEDDLYNEAIQFFFQSKYKQALRVFQNIEDLYPLSYLATQAKLLSGIASYNMGDYNIAARSMDEYIHLYSNSDDLPYAYYLRILSYYMQINDVQREQETAHKTLELVTEYINRLPNTEYINDVRRKQELIINHILEKEYSIGRFYFNRGEYLAAIKQFRSIINDENFNYRNECTRYLVKSYLALGMTLEVEQHRS
nr:outer membrane protein assembly factor BamD [Wolbachia endosymbiont of Fragariocoptes setiger]